MKLLALLLLAIDPAKLIDLTYAFDSQTIYWPNAKGFSYRRDSFQKTPQGFFYAAGGFSMDEHGGTHVDAPIHFAEGKQTLDAIPIEKFVGPAFVIDIGAQAAKNRDYTATPADIAAFEKQHGAIPPGAIVVFRTGWGKHWPNRKAYLGSDVPGDVHNLHFPGIGKQAAAVLAQRRVTAIGIDTASTDPGNSKLFEAHQVISGANIYGIENIANAGKLPVKGATLIVAPLKIKGGSGGPARVFAVLP